MRQYILQLVLEASVCKRMARTNMQEKMIYHLSLQLLSSPHRILSSELCETAIITGRSYSFVTDTTLFPQGPVQSYAQLGKTGLQELKIPINQLINRFQCNSDFTYLLHKLCIQVSQDNAWPVQTALSKKCKDQYYCWGLLERKELTCKESTDIVFIF